MKRELVLTGSEITEAPENTLVLEGDFRREHTILLALSRLWLERQVIVKAALLGFVFAVVTAFLIPPMYESTVRLMPPDSKSGASALELLTGGSDEKMGALASQLLGAKTSGAVFIGIMKSRTVQDRLIDRFQLMTVYRIRLRKDAREKLAGNTDIEEDRKSGIISITVRDRSKERAVGLARAYVEELDKLSVSMTTSAAHREREFLEQRLGVVKQEVDDAARDLSDFSTRNSTLDITEQGKATIAAAASLEGELIAAQSQLASLRAIYNDTNVRVRAMNDRVAELRRQLIKIQGPAQATATDAPAEPGDVIVPIRKLPVIGVTYLDLYRRLKIGEAVFETLTKQYELAKVEEAKEIPTVKVLDDAALPEIKSTPHRTLIVAFGTLLACLACVAYLLAYDRWQRLDVIHPLKSFVLHVQADMKSDIGHYRSRLKRKSI